MKKLMIAAAIVCAAVVAQASAIKWSSAGISATAGVIYGPDTSTLINTWSGKTGYSITSVMLMNVAAMSQSDLLEGIRNDTYTWGDSALDTTSVNSSSKITTKTTSELTGLAGQTISVYYAILAEDNKGNQSLLISNAKPAGVPIASGDTVSVSWASDSPTFSKVSKGTGDYSAAGWYAIPEPTSGLLLLLGMAGLALKRKRA